MTDRSYHALTPDEMARWDAGQRRTEDVREREPETATIDYPLTAAELVQARRRLGIAAAAGGPHANTDGELVSMLDWLDARGPGDVRTLPDVAEAHAARLDWALERVAPEDDPVVAAVPW